MVMSTKNSALAGGAERGTVTLQLLRQTVVDGRMVAKGEMVSCSRATATLLLNMPNTAVEAKLVAEKPKRRAKSST